MNETKSVTVGQETICLRSGANLKVGDRFLYHGNRPIKEVKPNFNHNTLVLDGDISIDARHKDVFEFNHHSKAWQPMSRGVVTLLNKAAPQDGETQGTNSSRMFMGGNSRCIKELKPIEFEE